MKAKSGLSTLSVTPGLTQRSTTRREQSLWTTLLNQFTNKSLKRPRVPSSGLKCWGKSISCRCILRKPVLTIAIVRRLRNKTKSLKAMIQWSINGWFGWKHKMRGFHFRQEAGVQVVSFTLSCKIPFLKYALPIAFALYWRRWKVPHWRILEKAIWYSEFKRYGESTHSCISFNDKNFLSLLMLEWYLVLLVFLKAAELDSSWWCIDVDDVCWHGFMRIQI